MLHGSILRVSALAAALASAAPAVAAEATVQAPDAAGILLSASTQGEGIDGLRAILMKMRGVEAVAPVGRRYLHLVRSWNADGEVVTRTRPGYAIPVDATVIDPETFAALVAVADAPAVAALAHGDALLGVAAADVRGLGVGGRLEMNDGSAYVIRGIIDDGLIQNRELVIAEPGYGTGESDSRPRLVFRYTGPQETLEDDLTALLPEDAPLRLRALEPSEFIRTYAPVLPQARIKLALGEFSYRPGAGRSFERDPWWVEENLVTAVVPILGRVRCHRMLIPALHGAMQEVIDRGLAFLVDAGAYRGCDNPRLIAVGRGVSRHAWAAAVDLNYGDDAEVRANAADPRLVSVMQRWGFTSGHLWNRPDPGHFEYVGAPQGRAFVPAGG